MAVRSLFPILLARDLPQLVRFYESALGATVAYRFGSGDEDDYVSLAIGEASLGIGRDPDALPRRWATASRSGSTSTPPPGRQQHGGDHRQHRHPPPVTELGPRLRPEHEPCHQRQPAAQVPEHLHRHRPPAPRRLAVASPPGPGWRHPARARSPRRRPTGPPAAQLLHAHRLQRRRPVPRPSRPRQASRSSRPGPEHPPSVRELAVPSSPWVVPAQPSPGHPRVPPSPWRHPPPPVEAVCPDRLAPEASGSWWAPRSSNSVFAVQSRS